MISLQTDCQKNTYSAYHIAKAFYPEEEIHVEVKEDGITPDLLYLALKDKTGRDLPWGMLTGVRPTKLAMQKIRENMSEENFIRWFGETRYVSREKAKLAYEIASNEKEILSRAGLGIDANNEDTWSLYVNIPFCPTICTYCSFSSGAIKDYGDVIEDYLDCLFRELDAIRTICSEKKLLSIYIGGGTPTTLTENQLEALLKKISGIFKPGGIEYTLEAGRPDTITEEKLQIALQYGVNRISINPQSMQEQTLEVIGRKHSPKQITEAFAQARAAGFDNINMDLIMGLPGEGIREAEDTLQKILNLNPDSLTIHSLAIKRASQLFRQSTSAETVEEMLTAGANAARAAGMKPYYLYRQKGIAGNFENIGWAREGKESLYNILIMEEIHSIVAAGAGASTKRVLAQEIPVAGKESKKTKILRFENVSDIREYLTRVDEMIERKKNLFST